MRPPFAGCRLSVLMNLEKNCSAANLLTANRSRLHYLPAETFLIFPLPSRHVRTGAQRRNLHYAGSIAVLHSVATLQVHRCAPPVLRLCYGRGKHIFNTNESKHPTRRGAPEHVAYFANPSNRDSSSSDVANCP